ncbi:hypothetical protein BGZ83_007899 [Gryganskiella cystojenkinii]|nr:hypothetical protein BGZ83_007899 [Gryganskiella cystojenkinii]
MRFFVVAILSVIVAPVFAAVQTVVIKNSSFMPQKVNINPGDQVTWTNNDSFAHTVTADVSSVFDSGNLAPGKSFSHTFATAGTVTYHCSIHPFMLGSVVAGSATTGTATAVPTATPTNSGNTLHAPVQVILAIGGGAAVLAQLL